MLRDVKVGDRVKSCLAGWGTVKLVDDGPMFPVMVKFDAGIGEIFTLEGKRNENHIYPEIVEVEKKKKKWEPEGGPCFIRGDGSIGMARKIPNNKPDYYKEEGRAFPTEKTAEKAYKMIRSYQRLIAYVLEHCPVWEPDWCSSEEDIAYIYYEHDAEKWDFVLYHDIEYIGIPMPGNVAEELCEKLNSGEVEL
jgi:hypothetical protein